MKYDLIVTGSQGNIGSILMQNFQGSKLGITRDNWDVIKNSKIEASTLVHCAFDLKHSYADEPTAMIDSNVLATAKLLEFAKSNHIKKFIFISSCAVYGHSSNTSEKNQCMPISINGHVKLVNELFVEEFCRKHHIKSNIFRVFNLFGGVDHFSVVSQLLKSIKTNKPFKFNNEGISQRDFIHVEDVCDIISKAIVNDYDFTVLNLGTGRSTQIRELVTIVKNKYPELNIVSGTNNEIEYSRANLMQFNKYFNKQFINVCDFLDSELKNHL